MLQFVNTMFKNISQKMLNRNEGGRFKEAAAAQIKHIKIEDSVISYLVILFVGLVLIELKDLLQ